MTKRGWPESWRRGLRNRARLGLIAVFLCLALPSLGHADEQWSEGSRVGLEKSSDANTASFRVGEQVVAALTPGSVLTAQVAGAPSEKEGWQFSVAPYLWTFRTKMSLDVDVAHGSTTIDFVDAVPQLHFAFAAHAEATWQKWTGFLDLFYVSLGQSREDRISLNLQELFFEFGAMYRLGPVPLGQAGKLSFEPLAGGRFMWMDASLGFPNQKFSDSASVIDPMVGGRITYRITGTVALWFRGDVAGFGISDNQSQLTYNLIGGLEWRFVPRASALVGWRYMRVNVDPEKGSGDAQRFNADVEMNGPFLALNVHF